MNTGAKALLTTRGSKMIKFAMVALFAMSMATLALAASALPTETAVTASVNAL